MDDADRRLAVLSLLMRQACGNPNTDGLVLEWLNTDEGNQFLLTPFAVIYTADYLGMLTIGPVEGVDECLLEEQVLRVMGKSALPAIGKAEYLEKALALYEGEKRANPLPGNSELHIMQLRNYLQVAIAKGIVVTEDDMLRLSASGVSQYLLGLRVRHLYENGASLKPVSPLFR